MKSLLQLTVVTSYVLMSNVQFSNVNVIGYKRSNKWVCRVSVITPRSSHNVEV